MSTVIVSSLILIGEKFVRKVTNPAFNCLPRQKNAFYSFMLQYRMVDELPSRFRQERGVSSEERAHTKLLHEGAAGASKIACLPSPGLAPKEPRRGL